MSVIFMSVSLMKISKFFVHLLSGTTVLKSLDVLVGVIPSIKQQSLSCSNDHTTNVDIYVLPDCPWSKRALNLLDSNDIKYKYSVITNDEEFQYIINRTSINNFPQIFINNEFIGGYSELLDLSNSGILNKLLL